MTDKINLETAGLEFDRFTDIMEIDVDESFMDESDLTNFHKLKRRLIKAICAGSLIINDEGKAVYNPQKLPLDNPLVFNQKNGAALQAMDGKKNNHSVAQTYAVMAVITKVHPSTFSKMEGNDLSICMGLFMLLMD